MFENFGTAIVQAVGFLGVFGFFVYRLLSEKVPSNPPKENTNNKSSKTVETISSKPGGFFGRRKNIEKNIDVNNKEIKRGWFKR